MASKFLRGSALVISGTVALAAMNSSAVRAQPGHPVLLAHRGLAQDFSRVGLDQKTCTARRMLPSRHGFLENTLPSIAAALNYGADVVEIDIHPTTDNEFAVFHDWTLDCRTDGKGVTRTHAMSYLKTLDVGHGYTSDGGKTFPFRGKAIGAMPTFAEVMKRFPKTRLLVNIKGNTRAEGDKIADYLSRHNAETGRLMFYGGQQAVHRLGERLPDLRRTHKSRLRKCLLSYFAIGWTGLMPRTCHNNVVFLPVNYRQAMWGWPNLFVDRLTRVNSELFLIGPMTGKTEKSGTTAIDDPTVLQPFIKGYRGGISTDHIEVIGPAIKGEDQLPARQGS